MSEVGLARVLHKSQYSRSAKSDIGGERKPATKSHSHGRLPEMPNSLSMDVEVDTHDFRPWHYDEIADSMMKKTELSRPAKRLTRVRSPVQLGVLSSALRFRQTGIGHAITCPLPSRSLSLCHLGRYETQCMFFRKQTCCAA